MKRLLFILPFLISFAAFGQRYQPPLLYGKEENNLHVVGAVTFQKDTLKPPTLATKDYKQYPALGFAGNSPYIWNPVAQRYEKIMSDTLKVEYPIKYNSQTQTVSLGTVPTELGGTGLTTPGVAGQLLRVNTGATGLEYFTSKYLTRDSVVNSVSGILKFIQPLQLSGSGEVSLNYHAPIYNSDFVQDYHFEAGTPTHNDVWMFDSTVHEWKHKQLGTGGGGPESDPVATANYITNTQGYGILIGGTASQTIGSNPSYSFDVDTSAISTVANVQMKYDVLNAMKVNKADSTDGGYYPYSTNPKGYLTQAVTSVATNNGTGITGGTITSTGTLAIDTASTISTKANAQKLYDILNANFSNYYTKTNLQTSGQASVHWGNITNAPTFLTSESDPVWTSASTNYYTKTNLQTSGQALVHWGNITNAPAFITSVSAVNGLTMSGTITTKLGGPLVENTTIGATNGAYNLSILSQTSGANTLYVRNYATGSGSAIYGYATDGAGTSGYSVNNNGLAGFSETGRAGDFKILPSTSGYNDVVWLEATTTGTAANGIGGKAKWRGQYTVGTTGDMGTIGFQFTNATAASATSQYDVDVRNNGGALTTRFSVKGNGQWQGSAYGAGSITGTPTRYLAVDASGNVIEATSGTIVSGGGGITSESDPIATAKTVSINQGSNIVVTGTTTQTVGANPSWTLSSNVTGLITAGSYIQITGSGTQASPYQIASNINALPWGGTINVTDAWGVSTTMGDVNQYIFTGSSPATFTLPTVATSHRVYFVKNRGSATLTVAAAASEFLYESGDVASISIPAGEGRIIATGASKWNVYANASGTGGGTTLNGTGYVKMSGTTPSYVASIPNADLANSAITVAGNATSLGGVVTLDQITGLSSTGIVKRTAANTFAIATPGTDYLSSVPTLQQVLTAGNTITVADQEIHGNAGFYFSSPTYVQTIVQNGVNISSVYADASAGAILDLGTETTGASKYLHFTPTTITVTTNGAAGKNLPLSVNGNFANASGDITVSETDPLALKIANNLSDLNNAATARTNLGGTTVGQAFFTTANPSAISFPKVSATNTVAYESAATHRTSIGATTVGGNLFTLTNPSAITFLKINADNTVVAESASTFRTSIGAGTGNGTVTGASVVSANGFAGTVATASTTPAITLTTTVTGVLKGNGSAMSAAVAETDYVTPSGSGTLTNKTINGNSNTISNIERKVGVSLVSPSASEKISLLLAPAAGATAVSGFVTVRGTSPSITYAIHYGTTYGTSQGTIVASNTVTTTGAMTIGTSAIPANAYVWLATTAVSGTIDEFTPHLIYKY